MAQLMEYAGYLAKEIGARPAGTEEEQQAALYITEQLQKEAGFTANIEEFTDSSNPVASRAIMALVVVLVTILAMIFPVLNIPAFILAAAATVIYVLEAYDRPIISRFLSQSASQNVIAKYQPAFDEGMGGKSRPRSRKIILVAHYDTGHVTPPLVERVQSTGLPLPLIVMCAMIVATFFQLLRIFIASGGGMGLIVLNVLSIVAIAVCLLPVVKTLLIRSAPYNEGANNNATGSAALIEVARRIARGSVSEADLAQSAEDDLFIHGEAAAREAGLIPEGVQIRYEAEQLVPPSEIGAYDEEERLLAAKAAIAAMTGKPVERRVFGSVADKLVNSRATSGDAEFVDSSLELHDGRAETGSRPNTATIMPGAGNQAALSFDAPVNQDEQGEEGAAEGFENAPSWFIAAQKNARKATSDEEQPVEVHRSKYTEAMEYAERGRAEREEEARAAEWAAHEEAQRKREEDIRAALEASARQGGDPFETVPELASLEEEPYTVEDESSYSEVAASPSSTIAMAAPIPASKILAEAAYLDAADQQAEMFEEQEESSYGRLPDLPVIDQAPVRTLNVPEVSETTNPSKSGLMRRLRTSVPSLSGLLDPVPDTASQQNEAARRAAVQTVPNVVSVPAFDTASASKHDEVAKEGDVDYNMEITFDEASIAEVPAPPMTVEVPRSRSASLLNRLRRDDDESLRETPQQWLDIDEDYEARSVGRERGSWESFRDDQCFDEEAADDFGMGDEERESGRRWQGGAYSRMSLGHVNMRSGADTEADSMIPVELPENEQDTTLTGEIEQIYHFRNPQFNTEIWFVAIGSDTEGHDGAHAFLEEHRDELRGSMIIEVESLGAGVLSVASEEGRVRKVTTSSRIKRYTRSAVAATGIALDEVSLAGTDSIASTMQKAGLQAMHLFGAENGRPALKNSADDVLENVDELLFDDNVNFVFELLKK